MTNPLRELMNRPINDSIDSWERLRFMREWLDIHAEAIAYLIDAAQAFIDALDKHEAEFGDKLFPKYSDGLRAVISKLTEGK